MIATRVALPGVDVLVVTPEEVADTVAAFYPRSARAAPGRSASTHEYTLVTAGDRWALSKNGSPAGDYATPAQALLAMEYELETVVVARRGDRIAMHAGAVVVGRGACVIPGNPDSGKTTTTFNLVELGHAFLCEEIALVHPATHVVEPFAQSLTLGRSFLEATLAELPATGGTVVPLDDRFARYVPARIADEGVRVDRLLVPRYEPGTPGRVDELEPGDALTEILGYCFEPNRGEERLFDSVIGLVAACRVERLCYGSVEQARERLARLLE